MSLNAWFCTTFYRSLNMMSSQVKQWRFTNRSVRCCVHPRSARFRIVVTPRVSWRHPTTRELWRCGIRTRASSHVFCRSTRSDAGVSTSTWSIPNFSPQDRMTQKVPAWLFSMPHLTGSVPWRTIKKYDLVSFQLRSGTQISRILSWPFLPMPMYAVLSSTQRARMSSFMDAQVLYLFHLYFFSLQLKTLLHVSQSCLFFRSQYLSLWSAQLQATNDNLQRSPESGVVR